MNRSLTDTHRFICLQKFQQLSWFALFASFLASTVFGQTRSNGPVPRLDPAKPQSLDQPAQRWLPLPEGEGSDTSAQTELLKQLREIVRNNLSNSREGNEKSSFPEMTPERIEQLKKTLEQMENQEGGIPNSFLSGIPPHIIEKALEDPNIRREAQKFLEQYSKDRKLPRTDPSSGTSKNGSPIPFPSRSSKAQEPKSDSPFEKSDPGKSAPERNDLKSSVPEIGDENPFLDPPKKESDSQQSDSLKSDSLKIDALKDLMRKLNQSRNDPRREEGPFNMKPSNQLDGRKPKPSSSTPNQENNPIPKTRPSTRPNEASNSKRNENTTGTALPDKPSTSTSSRQGVENSNRYREGEKGLSQPTSPSRLPSNSKTESTQTNESNRSEQAAERNPFDRQDPQEPQDPSSTLQESNRANPFDPVGPGSKSSSTRQSSPKQEATSGPDRQNKTERPSSGSLGEPSSSRSDPSLSNPPPNRPSNATPSTSNTAEKTDVPVDIKQELERNGLGSALKQIIQQTWADDQAAKSDKNLTAGGPASAKDGNRPGSDQSRGSPGLDNPKGTNSSNRKSSISKDEKTGKGEKPGSDKSAYTDQTKSVLRTLDGFREGAEKYFKGEPLKEETPKQSNGQGSSNGKGRPNEQGKPNSQEKANAGNGYSPTTPPNGNNAPSNSANNRASPPNVASGQPTKPQGPNEFQKSVSELWRSVSKVPEASTKPVNSNPSVGSEGWSLGFQIDWRTMAFALMILLLAGFLLLARRRLVAIPGSKQQDQIQIAEILAAGIRTRDDVVKAFHRLALKRSKPALSWWTHRYAASRISESTPEIGTAIQTIANVYEEARYSPPDVQLNLEQINSVQHALQQCQPST